jgi:NAD(P)H-hydrate repair Nnr-like enzyme with NAD(P)H-hydrate dehydratase domain
MRLSLKHLAGVARFGATSSTPFLIFLFLAASYIGLAKARVSISFANLKRLSEQFPGVIVDSAESNRQSLSPQTFPECFLGVAVGCAESSQQSLSPQTCSIVFPRQSRRKKPS